MAATQPMQSIHAPSQCPFQPYTPTTLQTQYMPSNIASLPTPPSSFSCRISINPALSTPVAPNVSFAATYPHYPTPITTNSSQFDSPTFNNGPYRQPLFNSLSYYTPVALSHTSNFPLSPQFQTTHSYPYSPHPYSYQPLPGIRPTTSHAQHNTHQYYTDIGLNSSPFVVPSHRDVDTRPVGDAGSDMLLV